MLHTVSLTTLPVVVTSTREILYSVPFVGLTDLDEIWWVGGYTTGIDTIQFLE